ncbi:hypothetical protein PR202_gb16761 [Eleusine coracana subsp. coracana]|uniref:Helicase ATP-binding domain-containing protein n=1 Tax=Eleusine coracana subsp. coracana TaxID=191504 RepID=A0AAV5EYW8_ELECO|nr:hypothetical protein PR202_gb16761 [Eleusine coracana subsp. coracana]
MSAPPQPPPPAVDDFYYDDEGMDWDAAWLEVDKVCALKETSASAPDPEPVQTQPPPPPRLAETSGTAPIHKPSSAGRGGARQSTLDRFINPSTGVQLEKERPAPAPSMAPAGGGGHPRRQACENGLDDRFMSSFSLRRKQEKAASAPVVAPPRGRGCPGTHARKGCERQAGEEIMYDRCAVALDDEAVQTWTYPTNVPIRKYQKDMVEKALFTNTLVALPTGLGKTFIAAVVMYNYFRWFPEGKIVFTAPSRPLVTQQIEACHNVVGIPQEWAVEMKGSDSPSDRSVYWKSKRVFFVTPQVLDNDIQSGDLVEAHVPLRILALTATPGSKHADIQNVINSLCISELVYYDEEDSEVRKHINTRDVEVKKIPFGSDATEVNNLLLDIMRPHLNRLRDAGVIDPRDSAKSEFLVISLLH